MNAQRTHGTGKKKRDCGGGGVTKKDEGWWRVGKKMMVSRIF